MFGYPVHKGKDASLTLSLNKDLMHIKGVIVQIKNEMQNPLSLINKKGISVIKWLKLIFIGLILLEQLLEINKTRRISASEALDHPYFIPTLNKSTLETADSQNSQDNCPESVPKYCV